MSRYVRIDTWDINPWVGFLHMGLDRFRLARMPGLTFYKLLGTGKGDTFGLRDANPRRWAVLTVWETPRVPAEFEHFLARWNRAATEYASFELEPLAGHGTWAKVEPFSYTAENTHHPIAVITRARIKPRFWRSFYRNVPSVVADLHQQESLLMRFGIGEAPIGLQGTFSVWRDVEAIKAFAYQNQAHRAVIHRTNETGWYSEELFARFKVTAVQGTLEGRDVQSWLFV